jgi:hypothetical protein
MGVCDVRSLQSIIPHGVFAVFRSRGPAIGGVPGWSAGVY